MNSRIISKDTLESKMGPGSVYWRNAQRTRCRGNYLIEMQFKALTLLEEDIQTYKEKMKGKRLRVAYSSDPCFYSLGNIDKIVAEGYVHDIKEKLSEIIIPTFNGKVILKNFREDKWGCSEDYHFVKRRFGHKELSKEDYNNRQNRKFRNGILLLCDRVNFDSDYLPIEPTEDSLKEIPLSCLFFYNLIK